MVCLTHWPLGQRPSQGVCCFFNQPLSSQRQTPRWHCRTTESRVWILSYHTCPGRIKKDIRLKYQGLHGMGPGFEPVLFGSWIRKESVFRQAVFTSTQRDPVNSKIGWSSSSKSRGSPNPSMRQKSVNISSHIAVAMYTLKVEAPCPLLGEEEGWISHIPSIFGQNCKINNMSFSLI